MHILNNTIKYYNVFKSLLIELVRNISCHNLPFSNLIFHVNNLSLLSFSCSISFYIEDIVFFIELEVHFMHRISILNLRLYQVINDQYHFYLKYL